MTARDARTAAFLVAIFAAVVVQCSPPRRYRGSDLVMITGALPSRLRSLPRVRHRDGHPQPPGLTTAEMALAMKATG
jgi:hypothetical protein